MQCSERLYICVNMNFCENLQLPISMYESVIDVEEGKVSDVVFKHGFFE